jgi:hypothetical protein
MKEKNRTIKQWYDSLPANDQANKRESVMFLLGIERSAFYKLLNGTRIFNPAEIAAINGLAEENLDYGQEEDLTVSTNLVKA